MKNDVDPRAYARVGGILYLTIIALGIFQEFFVRGRIAAGDAAATFANLESMQMLWRLGITAELVMVLVNVVIGMVLYVLTRPVHKDLALLAMLFGLVATTVEAAYSMQLVEALFPLGSNAYLAAFTPGQLHAMMALAMKAHVLGFGVALLFFGPVFFVTGYLVYASGYIPKTLGVLYQLAGVGYMVNGFVLVLAPQFAGKVFFVMVISFVGEVSLAVWMLTRGVRIEAWRVLEAHP